MQNLRYIHANNQEVRLRLALRRLQEQDRKQKKIQTLRFMAMVVACFVLAGMALLAPVVVNAAYERFFF